MKKNVLFAVVQSILFLDATIIGNIIKKITETTAVMILLITLVRRVLLPILALSFHLFVLLGVKSTF